MPVAAFNSGWMSSRPIPKVRNWHRPDASMVDTTSWNSFVRPALPSVAAGSAFSGMPKTSAAMVYAFKWQAPRLDVA